MYIRKFYLLNYIFVIGIVILFINDRVLKWEFPNWFTGKLSDFIGLFIFPFFLTFLFPKAVKWNVILTGLFFVIWKSPYSQGFIDLYNSITFIKITRVVDYSDLIAISILPISYYFIVRLRDFEKLRIEKINIHPMFILVPTIIVFMATSPPIWHSFHLSQGNVNFHKNYINVNKSQVEILSEIRSMNIHVKRDTSMYSRNTDRLDFFVVDELVIDKDTIKNLRFSLVSFKESKTKVFLNAITIFEDINENEVKKELKTYYRGLLRKYFRKKLK